jgi:predicted nucleotidyltransferase
MRKRAAIDALFPTVRKGILRLTFSDPEHWWYLSELARVLDTQPSSLQREVDALARTGVLEARKDGRRMYYRADRESAIFGEIRGIVQKTMGVTAEVQAALQPLSAKITHALIFGSVARAEDRAGSDIDLLVVSDDLTLEELFGRLHRVEKKLQRKINPTLYTTDEFRERRRKRNHFLENVLRQNPIVLIGTGQLDAATR